MTGVLSTIYFDTLKPCSGPLQIHSYDVPRGGLHMLKRHAFLFKDHLLKKYEKTMERIQYWMSHK